MFPKYTLKTIVILFFFLALFPVQTSAKPKKIVLSATPVSFSLLQKEQIVFDKLIYRGGIELKSENKNFGGLSGLSLSPNGTEMIAVSDRGYWFGGKVVYKNGQITGLEKVAYDRLTDISGGKLRGRNNKDSESITSLNSPKLSDGVLVAFERKEKLYAYKTKGTKILPGARRFSLPPEIHNGPHNKELESVVRFHQGKLKNTILIFSEKHQDEDQNIKGWILKGKTHAPLFVKAWGGFSITDAAILPKGDLLILERAVSPFTGWSMQIRMIKSERIKPGAILDGPILLQASQLMMIDNMEGLALHKDQKGRVIMSLVSDNNFKEFQRTLLLQFEIPANLLN